MIQVSPPDHDDQHDEVGACIQAGWLAGLSLPLAALNDEEQPRLPADMPPVIDAHVHLFPERVFEAIWRWFERYGWPIRYKLDTPHVIDFLFSRGVRHIIALHYAHRPGMATFLNETMAEVCKGEPRITGLATVMPGEADAPAILERGFAMGLRGVKLHCHVQCMAPDDPAMMELYEVCVAHDLPAVVHAGREPSSPHYACDTRAICSAARVERVLEAFPGLRLCVPHLGADEFDDYERMVRRYDNLWLDTTMAMADYFPGPLPLDLIRARPDRILYGTDFPNLPYAWDRELRILRDLKLGSAGEELLFGGVAADLFGVNL